MPDATLRFAERGEILKRPGDAADPLGRLDAHSAHRRQREAERPTPGARTRHRGGPFFLPKASGLKSPKQSDAAPASDSMGPIRQWLSRARAVRYGSGSFMTRFPVFESVQPGADGANRHPALKAVAGSAVSSKRR
jgi:hypothetical protein